VLQQLACQVLLEEGGAELLPASSTLRPARVKRNHRGVQYTRLLAACGLRAPARWLHVLQAPAVWRTCGTWVQAPEGPNCQP
jgi:hypothetical protein